jgi:hypothetical protein
MTRFFGILLNLKGSAEPVKAEKEVTSAKWRASRDRSEVVKQALMAGHRPLATNDWPLTTDH